MLTPIHNPVLIMALAMGMFLVVPLLFERLRLPSIIGLILAGALVGPDGLNLLERDETIQLLGTVGLLYLMFVAGLELDLVGFIKHRTSSLTFGLLTFAFPMLLPLALIPFFDLSWAATILIGAIVASHTPIAYPIASRLGISKNPAITAAMGGTLVTDTLSLVVLAIVSSYVDGASSVQFWIIKFSLLAAFCFVVLQGLPRLGRWFFRYVGNQPIAQYAFLLTALFGTAFLAEELNSKDLIGAFLAGLALNRLVPDTSALMNRLQFVGNSLFMPFFLLSVGMLVDVQVLTDPTVWFLAAMLSVILLVGKGLAALVSQRLFNYSPAQGFLMLGMSLPQAAATLAVTFVGYDIGLFDESMINAVVVLIMLSCLLGPWLVERYGRKVGLESDLPAAALDTPQRLLIPIGTSRSSETLLDLAAMLREPGSSEALFPLAVVTNDDTVQSQVASAEKRLANTVMHAAGADVPTTPLVRIATNTVVGTLRAVSEQRISDVVMTLEPDQNSWLFGSALEQLLASSDCTVWAARLNAPVNTHKRAVLLLPPLSDHHPSYQQSIRALKLLANRLSMPLLGLVIQTGAERIARHFAAVKPDIEQTFETVSWDGLSTRLSKLDTSDLCVLFSFRRGSLTWTQALTRLEHSLIEGHIPGLPANSHQPAPFSLLVHYASEPNAAADLQVTNVPAALAAERVMCNVPESNLHDVIETLLQQEFVRTPERCTEALTCLFNDPTGFEVEVLPEALVAHARIDIPQTLMFLVTSTAQLTYHNQARQVAGLLLSPIDDPLERHHEELAAFANFLHEQGGRLCHAQSFQDLFQIPAVAATPS